MTISAGPATPAARALKVGVTFHSFTTEFVSYAWSFEDLMYNATQLGGGVEIVGPVHHRDFPEVPDEFVTAFRSSVDRHGLTPTSYGSYADPFLRWDRRLSDDELVDYTIPQIVGAARLGFPVVRLQHFAAEIIERILPTAERVGVRLGYELHVPLELESERTHELVTQIRRLSSAHLGLIPDAGIFGRSVSTFRIAEGRTAGLTDDQVARVVDLWRTGASLQAAEELVEPFGAGQRAAEWAHGVWGSYGHSDPADLRDIVDHVIHVHAKFYSIENGDEPDLRYRDLVFALLDLGYDGWLSSEYEGPPADSFLMVAQQQDMIAAYVREYNDLRSTAAGRPDPTRSGGREADGPGAPLRRRGAAPGARLPDPVPRLRPPE